MAFLNPIFEWRLRLQLLFQRLGEREEWLLCSARFAVRDRLKQVCGTVTYVVVGGMKASVTCSRMKRACKTRVKQVIIFLGDFPIIIMSLAFKKNF